MMKNNKTCKPTIPPQERINGKKQWKTQTPNATGSDIIKHKNKLKI